MVKSRTLRNIYVNLGFWNFLEAMDVNVKCLNNLKLLVCLSSLSLLNCLHLDPWKAFILGAALPQSTELFIKPGGWLEGEVLCTVTHVQSLHTVSIQFHFCLPVARQKTNCLCTSLNHKNVLAESECLGIFASTSHRWVNRGSSSS